MCVCFSHYSGHVIRPQNEWNSWTFSTSACSSSPFLVLLPSVSLLYFQSPTEKSPTPLCCCSISPAKFTPRISLPLHFLILLLDSYGTVKEITQIQDLKSTRNVSQVFIISTLFRASTVPPGTTSNPHNRKYTLHTPSCSQQTTGLLLQ